MAQRVASLYSSFSCAGGEFSGFPESSPPALPPVRVRVSPNPASTAESMMNPCLSLKYQSLACAADQPFPPARSALFCPALDATSISIGLFTAEQAGLESPHSNCRLHRTAGLKLRCQFLCGSPAVWTLGRVDLWKQVQIREGICGYHRSWCS